MIRTGRTRRSGALALGLLILIAAAGWSACRDQAVTTAPVPRPVDTASLDAAALPLAVLDECHRPLRGRMDRIAAELRLSSGTVWRVFAALPHQLRAVGPRGTFLVCDEQVWSLGESQTSAAPAALRAELTALLPLLDAAALGPLHRAIDCRRDGAAFVLRAADGSETRLQLRPGTLLPAAFVGRGGEVRCLDYLRTSSTWMVARAASAALGEVALTFEQADLDWREDFFTPPASASAPPAPPPASDQTAAGQLKWTPGGGEQRSAEPQLAELRAHRRVLLDDPGSWPDRTAAYREVAAELERQDQALFGFPILFESGGKPLLAVPFRPRRAERGLEPPAGWRVVEVPAGRQLVVFPPHGDLAERRAEGERLLRAALERSGLAASGPVVCQPYLHLEEGEPQAAELLAPVVRSSVPVR